MKLVWRKNHATPAPAPLSREERVVATVEERTAAAAHLARIADQDKLADPRTNPEVRPMVDALRNAQQRMLLRAEHGRTERRFRITDRHAADAELTLEAILQARQANSPARSVLALHRGRARFMGAALTASVALSCGSAAGVEALATANGAPELTGYVAEVGMVGLSTMAILYRSHLSQHGWDGGGWKDTVLWAMAIVPLLASVAANAAGAGPVGVACSIGAAAFGVFSHLIGDASSEALLAKAREVSGEDEAGLRAVAMGDDVFSAPAVEPVVADEPKPLEPAPATTPEVVAVEPVTNHSEIVTAPVGNQPTNHPAEAATPVSDHPREAATNHPGDDERPVENQPTTTEEPVTNHPEDRGGNRSETTEATTPQTVETTGRSEVKRPVGNRKNSRPGRPQSEENEEAVALYRQSVKNGEPMSQRVLAAKFNRSTGWARARIAEAGLQPVGRSPRPVENHPVTNHSDDRDDDRSETAKEATA